MNAKSAIFIASCALLLGACSGEEHSDLREFVKESDKMPGGRIPPLPEVQISKPPTITLLALLGLTVQALS